MSEILKMFGILRSNPHQFKIKYCSSCSIQMQGSCAVERLDQQLVSDRGYQTGCRIGNCSAHIAEPALKQRFKTLSNQNRKCNRFNQSQYFSRLFSQSWVKNKIRLPHFLVCQLVGLAGALNRRAVEIVDDIVWWVKAGRDNYTVSPTLLPFKETEPHILLLSNLTNF